jgi:hypothetical protein
MLGVLFGVSGCDHDVLRGLPSSEYECVAAQRWKRFLVYHACNCVSCAGLSRASSRCPSLNVALRVQVQLGFCHAVALAGSRHA